MRRQAVRSIRYALLMLCGIAVVWFLEYIDSWLVAPAFVLLVLFAIAFSSISDNVKSIRDKLSGRSDPDEN